MNEKWLIMYPKMNETVRLTLILFPTPLGGFSPFSWWPLIFHFSSVTSLLRHCHLHHICSFPPPFLHSIHFIQCWSLCELHVALAIFTQLFTFLYFVSFFARSLWRCCRSNFHLWSPQALSHCAMGNNLGHKGRRLTSLSKRRKHGGEILTIPTL